MNGLTWLVLQTLGIWAAEIIVLTACVLYARRARSSVSVALASGAAGRLLVSVASSAITYLLIRGGPQGSAWFGSVSIGLNLLSVAFSLLFAISLLLVLRDATRQKAPTEQAPQPDAPEVGAQ